MKPRLGQVCLESASDTREAIHHLERAYTAYSLGFADYMPQEKAHLETNLKYRYIHRYIPVIIASAKKALAVYDQCIPDALEKLESLSI